MTFWWQEAWLFHSTPMINYSWFQGMDITWILHSNSTSENLFEAKVFTINNSIILKIHLKNPVHFSRHLLFCGEAQNYKIRISVTLFWKFLPGSGSKQEVAIIIISSVLVCTNINANLFSFLWFLYSRRRRSKNWYGLFILDLEQILNYIRSLPCMRDETDLRNYLAKAAWD